METSFEIYNLTDDGIIPNSKYPVVLYRNAFSVADKAAADFLENTFSENGWRNSFRWRVYDYHHYHTNTHEVLGVYAGKGILQLGGPHGEKMELSKGDVVILPAGTGHISLSYSENFAVVGAYPEGVEPDLVKITDARPEGVREKVDGIPVPDLDPLFGDGPGGLVSSWKERLSRSVAD
jgi:uncharacterized protein YjlB